MRRAAAVQGARRSRYTAAVRTLLFLVGGAIAGAIVSAAGKAGGLHPRIALAVFALAWIAIAAWNLREGVVNAGYTVAEELPIFLVIALIPIAITWWLSRR
jgi:hypothetical protein